MSKNYFKRFTLLSEDEVEILEENFTKLRDRFLLYKAAGRTTRNSTENALFDVFEGNEDIKIDFQGSHIISFCTVVLVFGDLQELEDYVREAKETFSP